MAATYTYPLYELTNMASCTPTVQKRDEQTLDKENYEPVVKPCYGYTVLCIRY